MTIKNVGFLSTLALVLTIISLPTTTHAEMLTRQLELGMSGADVSSLQTFLALDTSIYPQGLVTGYFGTLTKTAVANFQTKNGISSVGRVGPVTMLAINEQMTGNNTVGYHRAAPVIGALNVNVSNTNATISWNTDEGASAIIYYSNSPLSAQEASDGNSVTISGSTLIVNSDIKLAHSGTITGLVSNTPYYYIVYVRDSFGNESVTTQNTFRTTN